jgi:Ca-activated chloride channel family protein
MNFAWPHVLWFLIAPAALVARELARKYGDNAGGHPNILRAEAGRRSLKLRPAEREAGLGRKSRLWLCAGLALTIAALARPQWGRVDEPLFGQSREIIIAVDLSKSMLTPDVKPNRLGRARLLAQSLLSGLDGERVGLVSFAGTAFLQSPLSSDYAILDEFLPELDPDFMPVGGTDFGALMDTAAAAFGNDASTDRFLIVLSDGGATDDDWREHIGALKRKGVRVIALGIGTTAGGFIPDGAGGFVKDARGAVVLARLESDNLRELAKKTNGAYRDAGEWIDLPALLRATVEEGRKGMFLERTTARQAERYQWLLGPALLCLMASFLLEFPVRPSPRDLQLSAGEGGPAGAGGIAGVAVLLLALAPGLCLHAAEPDDVPLGRVVGRISSQDESSAMDWADIARETVSWGERLVSRQESVPGGPVRDALAAVDSGSAMDAKAADWPRLRGQLQELLRPPRDRKQPPPQNQPRQNPQDSRSNQDKRQQKPEKKDSQQPRGGTQKVGGDPDRSEETMARTKPEMAPMLDKLDQLRGQDSPAELWQKIEKNEPRPPTDKPAKDW